MEKIADLDSQYERYWECALCGLPSTEFTDHELCVSCATGDNGMTNQVFNFFSDADLSSAAEELDLLSLNEWYVFSSTIEIGEDDYADLHDSINAIMENYGAEIDT